MRLASIILMAALSVIIISPPAAALDAPVLSLQRLSVSAGLDYSKSSGAVGENYGKEFELKPSFNAAYNLGNRISVTGSVALGIKSEVTEYRAGLRLRLYRGSQNQ